MPENPKIGSFLECLFREPRLTFRALGRLPFLVRGFKFASGVPVPDGAFPPAPDQTSNPLRVYFEQHKAGRGIWKWKHYFDIYHRHLAKFVGRPVHVCEIGVYSGGSLEMWRDYFGEGCRIYGVDLQDACKAYENEYTRIFIGDQADRGFWRSFKASAPQLDVLIDDGGHRPEQQIATLEEMLPHLRPGGVFLCEDVHGVHNGFATYMHGLVKNLNAMGEGGRPAALQRLIESVHFYPYVTVVERATDPVARFEAPKHGTEWAPFSTDAKAVEKAARRAAKKGL